jgi:hypothetical protein
MAWRFRKSKNIGPFRARVSKKGIGTSFRFLGFRFGEVQTVENIGVLVFSEQDYIT